VAVCADTVVERAHALASLHPGAIAADDWRAVANNADIDVVLVSATPNHLAEITLACLEAGKHVLVEKPAGTSAKEIRQVAARAKALGKQVRVGFNHRFHPAMQKAYSLIQAGEVGELMFIRARYGHGARKGYEKEWRADPAIAGGGELIDQGFHLIDLSRWFFNDEFPGVSGFVNTYFWEMPVEDNAFMLLKTSKNKVAWLQTSWTEWKNLFSFEIFGKVGKIQIDGLGGSYGLEQLCFYRMSAEMGPPETMIWQYPQADRSFALEFESFMKDLASGVAGKPDLDDAIAAFDIAENIYQSCAATPSKAARV
jgi:predicted dehydrogenase